MRVYVLQFVDHQRLNGAFALLMNSERIGSCSAEPEASRLRFVAPAAPGEELVHRIYLDGGLTWCSRHECDGLPAVGEGAADMSVQSVPKR